MSQAFLIDETAATPEPFVLFIDSHNLIATQPIHDLPSFLLDYPPLQLNLITEPDGRVR